MGLCSVTRPNHKIRTVVPLTHTGLISIAPIANARHPKDLTLRYGNNLTRPEKKTTPEYPNPSLLHVSRSFFN